MFARLKLSHLPLGISLVFVVFVAWCSWQLHAYAKKYNLVQSAIEELISQPSLTLSPAHRAAMANSVEQQLACASTADIDFVQRFKSANNYPENAISFAIKTMLKSQVQVKHIALADSILTSDVLTGGGDNAIIVTMHFLKNNNKLMLIGIENICPVFEKLRCFEQLHKTRIKSIEQSKPFL